MSNAGIERIEPNDIRVKAVRAAVRSWRPRDEQGQESKRRFEEHLKKFLKQMNGEPDGEFEVTASAVVVSPQGTLVRAWDMLPTWIAANANFDESDAMWEVVQRRSRRTPGEYGGPEVLEVEIVDGDPGRIHIDVRFLLFSDSVDHEATVWPDDTFERALKVANALRDEALR